MAAPCARRGAGAPWALLVLALLASPLAAALKLDIDGQAIVDQLLHLATYSDDPNPAVTRILFTGGKRRRGAIAARRGSNPQPPCPPHRCFLALRPLAQPWTHPHLPCRPPSPWPHRRSLCRLQLRP